MAKIFDGTWYNQHGSQMVLTTDAATGRVSGTYKTGVGSPSPQESFELTGFFADDVIAFSVHFGKYGCLTSWAGQLTEDDSGVERIETMWHLAKNVPDADEAAKLWSCLWTGADTFTRTPAQANKGTLRARPSHPLK